MTGLNSAADRVRAGSDLRAALLAELRECEKSRDSVYRQLKRARQVGDRRKVADLQKQREATLRLVVEEWSTEDELDKIVPRRLRSPKGRVAWKALMHLRWAPAREKQNLMERVLKLCDSPDDAASYSFYQIMTYVWFVESEENRPAAAKFFGMLGIALEEENSAVSEKIKADLIRYREILKWIGTPPGQRRHTIEEIALIVAPRMSRTMMPTFRNWIFKLDVPYLPGKRGRASPYYGLAKKRARP